MEALDQFMKPKLLCQDISTAPLEVVGIDVIDHKNETYVIIHDYHTNFVTVERLTSPKNFMSKDNRGKEIISLLIKYFYEIFDRPVKKITSDNGRNKFTPFIEEFCTNRVITSSFPEIQNRKGISSKIIKAVVNLFEECKNDFIEVQIALSILRESAYPNNHSSTHMLFYEHKEKIEWNSDEYNNLFLDVTYSQLTIMKSKMDQQILAITNNLKEMNNNSINFRSYYPKIAPKELPIMKQINTGFAQGFKNMHDLIKCNQLNTAIAELQYEKQNPQDSNLQEIWGHQKRSAYTKKNLCIRCSLPSSAEHDKECILEELHCFNCAKSGHDSRSCFRKPRWSREDPVKSIELNDNKIHQMAEGDELLRRGLDRHNFENLNGKAKKLAMSARGFCLKCGKNCNSMDTCQARNAHCYICGLQGHYNKLCPLNHPKAFMDSGREIPKSLLDSIFWEEPAEIE